MRKIKQSLLGACIVLALTTYLVLYWRWIVMQADRHRAESLDIARFETAKAYIRIEHGRTVWFFDRFDPDEALAVNRIRQVYRLTDGEGKMLERSSGYEVIFGVPPPQADREGPILTPAVDHTGKKLILVTGAVREKSQDKFSLSVGTEVMTTNLALAYGISGLIITITVLTTIWAIRVSFLPEPRADSVWDTEFLQ